MLHSQAEIRSVRMQELRCCFFFLCNKPVFISTMKQLIQPAHKGLLISLKPGSDSSQKLHLLQCKGLPTLLPLRKEYNRCRAIMLKYTLAALGQGQTCQQGTHYTVHR